MRIDILTLFPETLGDVLSESILGRAQERGYISIEAHQIRDYTANKQNRVRSPIGYGDSFHNLKRVFRDFRLFFQKETSLCRDSVYAVIPFSGSPVG